MSGAKVVKIAVVYMKRLNMDLVNHLNQFCVSIDAEMLCCIGL